MTSSEDRVSRLGESLEQYKRDIEKNLTTIDSLEANIWEVTDEKNQLLAKIGGAETEMCEMMTRLQSQDEVNMKMSQEYQHLQQELEKKTQEHDHLVSENQRLSTELTSLQQLSQEQTQTSSTDPVPITVASSQDDQGHRITKTSVQDQVDVPGGHQVRISADGGYSSWSHQRCRVSSRHGSRSQWQTCPRLGLLHQILGQTVFWTKSQEDQEEQTGRFF